MSGRRASRSLLLLLLGLLALHAARGNPFDAIGDAVGDAVDAAGNAVGDAAGAVGSAVGTAVDAVQSGVATAVDAVGDALNVASGAVSDGLDTAVGAVQDGVNATTGWVSDVRGLADDLGDDVAAAINKTVVNGQRHPIVFWPGYGASVLQVRVANATIASCPSSGAFKFTSGLATQPQGFTEECAYPLLQTPYDAETRTFSNQPGVTTAVADFGNASCAPLYEPFFAVARAVGYSVGRDFRVACYDSRMNPFTDVGTDGAHLAGARALVEGAYAAAGGLPVYLVGHSNGPLYALALLASSTPAWRAKYVAGLISYAGNWVGQGAMFASFWAGLSIPSGGYLPAAAPALTSWPSTYMSAAFYEYYGGSEVVIRTTAPTGDVAARNYTPADAGQLFLDAGLGAAQQLAQLLIGNFTGNNTLPNTNFYGFIGTDTPTVVGSTFANLRQGQAPTPGGDLAASGDGDQEDTVNLTPLNWRGLQGCLHFELNAQSRVTHLQLPVAPPVVQRTMEIVFGGTPVCDFGGATTGTAGVRPAAPDGAPVTNAGR